MRFLRRALQLTPRQVPEQLLELVIVQFLLQVPTQALGQAAGSLPTQGLELQARLAPLRLSF